MSERRSEKMRRAQEIRLMTECAPNSYKEDRHVLGLVSPREQMINERTSPQIKQEYIKKYYLYGIDLLTSSGSERNFRKGTSLGSLPVGSGRPK